MSRNPFCAETAIRRRYEGWTLKEIAAEQGYGLTRAQNVLAQAGMALGQKFRIQARIERGKAIAARITAGETRAAIAKDMGISAERVAQLAEAVLPRKGSQWKDQAGGKDDLLRQLWADGVPTAEIGRRLGVTKNAAIGRARRLGLPGRGSPIKRSGKT